MLETRAIVVQTDGQHAFVEANQSGGCGHCNGKGCGTAKMSQMFCSKPRRFLVRNPVNAAVGDEVVVTVVEGTVLRGIGQVYLLPLLLLVAGATAGAMLASYPEQQDAYAVAGAVAGMGIGFVLAGWRSAGKRSSDGLPCIDRLWRE